MTPQENGSLNATDEVICEFTIHGNYHGANCLPSLNDLLSAATRHPMEYARMKRNLEYTVQTAYRMQCHGWKTTDQVRFDIVWGEKAKGQKRDYDNVVSAGRKIINDALVKLGVIQDDYPKFLLYGSNTFVYTDVPFVKVSIVKV